MYKKELKYIKIEYSNKDLLYIDELCKYIDSSCDEIISFLNIKNFGEKANVKLYDSLDDFRKYYIKIGYNLDENGETPKWVCGFAYDNDVHTLSSEEYRKTKSHENDSLEDLKYLVMHEFTHSCHRKISSNHYFWLCEGLATTITHQYDKTTKMFNATLNQMINGGTNYINYHTMFSYVYENYGRDYILKLINDFELLRKDTSKLYEETKSFYAKIQK